VVGKPAVKFGIVDMLGWLKRKTATAPSEPSPTTEEQKAPADDRLGRLLGRLGSEPAAAAGEHAETLVATRPVPPPRIDALVTTRPPSVALAPTVVVPPPRDPLPAEDPEEAMLNELYPPAARDARAAAAAALPAPALDRPLSEDAAAEQRAAEALAELDRRLAAAGDAVAVETAKAPGAPAAATPAAATAPEAAATAAAEPDRPPVSATAAAPGDQAVAPAPAVGAAPEIAPAIDAPAAVPADEEEADEEEEAAEETEPLPRAAPKALQRRPPKRSAEIDPLPSVDDKPPPLVERPAGFPEMFVIAVASQKGGAGKTTLAAHLAVRAGLAGQGPVVLIDTDPQGSLAEWWHARSDDTPALAVVKPEQLGANLAELRSYGTAVAIIDTPPALTGSIEQVIAMADLIVIPVRPSPHDLRAAGGTVEMARRAGKPFMFVVNGAAPRASITAQAVAALSEHGRVAPVILYQRTEYAASMIDGRTVVEAAASGRSAQEIADLWQCIYAQIGMRAAA
jgi:chromosome partitioning protein